MSALPGVGGSLFPRRYLIAGLERDLASPMPEGPAHAARRQLVAWWRRAEAACGPATGLRALVDVVALPLAAMLGFRARGVQFERDRAQAHLETRAGAIVGLVVLPWAARPSGRWRDLTAAARGAGADWCLLIAPPFVSVVDARGQAVRRSIDFTLPEALDDRSFRTFWALSRAAVFDEQPSDSLRREPRAATIDILVSRARHFQDRVRSDLQHGVVGALDALTGVLPQGGRKNVAPFDEALTLVYRILFLLFAEARDLVPVRHPVYGRAYAVGTLAQEALAGGAATTGLWSALAAVTRLSRAGCRHEDLIVRPFNGRLFARRSAPSLESGRHARGSGRSSAARDAAIARALVSLATRPGPGGREEITFADLGVEQLGAVYERVLDLGPVAVGRSGHSRQRKQTGTFYTPQPLAEFVVRRTLAPLVTGASTDQILALRVVDPAMGSGAFLVAACRYLATAYERALVEEGRSAEADLTDDARAGIRRLIAERCLAGVDLNPVAVQLARLSLWLTSLASGKPLGFLDHRLRVGNSLVGASPDDLWRNEVMRHWGPSTSLRAGKGAMKSGTPSLFDEVELEATLRQVVRPLAAMLTRPDDTVGDVRAKELAWSRLVHTSSPLEPWRLACSLWCARWFWRAPSEVEGPAPGKTDGPPSAQEMRAAFDALLKRDRTLDPRRLEAWLAPARAAAARIGFFHWPLEFADVFYEPDGQPRARPGFDAVIGNPPWEMLRADPGSAEPRPSTGSGRPEPVEGRNQLVHFLRQSGQFPSCDRGHVNLYQPFLARALSLARPGGRVGLILPWGLAADDGAATLRRKLFDETSVDTLVGLDNSAGLFPIHRGLRFLVLVAAPGRATGEVRMRCGVRTASEIDALPDVDAAGDASAFPLRMSRAIVTAVGGPAMRIPDARRPDDLVWFERLARSHPALGAADGWAVTFGRELNASDDRPYFGRAGLPVIEGKHIAPFAVDARAPTHRIRPEDAARRLPDRRFDRPRLAYRDVSGAANRLSLIAAVLPAGVVSTHTLFCLRTTLPAVQQHFLCGLFNSYVLNAMVRMLMGGHVTTSLVEGLPVPRWRNTPSERRIARLAERLERRPSAPGAHAALQAAVARLYGLDGDTFARILDGFPLVPEPDRRRALMALNRPML